ncbi:uncharacterized protein LOC135926095 isoform X2 [Gordionus sp. m RMFG-2023]|uniref:uncharacterized protein LOC135926095 isoform X2 n=1 Tax=Gordionus sp. m RMFG-2023 TaxID=3053472 RepID=UPI0031FBDAA5
MNNRVEISCYPKINVLKDKGYSFEELRATNYHIKEIYKDVIRKKSDKLFIKCNEVNEYLLKHQDSIKYNVKYNIKLIQKDKNFYQNIYNILRSNIEQIYDKYFISQTYDLLKSKTNFIQDHTKHHKSFTQMRDMQIKLFLATEKSQYEKNPTFNIYSHNGQIIHNSYERQNKTSPNDYSKNSMDIVYPKHYQSSKLRSPLPYNPLKDQKLSDNLTINVSFDLQTYDLFIRNFPQNSLNSYIKDRGKGHPHYKRVKLSSFHEIHPNFSPDFDDKRLNSPRNSDLKENQKFPIKNVLKINNRSKPNHVSNVTNFTLIDMDPFEKTHKMALLRDLSNPSNAQTYINSPPNGFYFHNNKSSANISQNKKMSLGLSEKTYINEPLKLTKGYYDFREACLGFQLQNIKSGLLLNVKLPFSFIEECSPENVKKEGFGMEFSLRKLLGEGAFAKVFEAPCHFYLIHLSSHDPFKSFIDSSDHSHPKNNKNNEKKVSIPHNIDMNSLYQFPLLLSNHKFSIFDQTSKFNGSMQSELLGNFAVKIQCPADTDWEFYIYREIRNRLLKYDNGLNIHDGSDIDCLKDSLRFFPKVFAAFIYSDISVLQMELFPNGTLLKLINSYKSKGKTMPDTLILYFACEILCMLNYLHHECHILHTDIKPDNFLLGDFSHLQILSRELQNFRNTDYFANREVFVLKLTDFGKSLDLTFYSERYQIPDLKRWRRMHQKGILRKSLL